MEIDPVYWQGVAELRSPKLNFTTGWYCGTQAPVRAGYYERHFTDSMSISNWSMQYWDGKYWRANRYAKPHWRQVGDYPAWRGLTKAQAALNKKGRRNGN